AIDLPLLSPHTEPNWTGSWIRGPLASPRERRHTTECGAPPPLPFLRGGTEGVSQPALNAGLQTRALGSGAGGKRGTLGRFSPLPVRHGASASRPCRGCVPEDRAGMPGGCSQESVKERLNAAR